MARHHKPKSIDNTGFGVNSNVEGGRLTNRDGSINLTKVGIPFWKRISLYHSLLRMPRTKFLLCIFLFYTVMNLIFASLYLMIGVDHLEGSRESQDGIMNSFFHAFFFSSQTLTTVGYGHVSPVGFWANVIASLESFFGILSFALVTGLLYGRFTRPKAYVMFSDNMLIAPHKGGTALMLRMATYKNNHLTDVETLMNIALLQEDNGKMVRRFYQLPLEIAKINSLALSWTVVHKIDEDSPLYGMTKEDMVAADIEILVFIKGFDDHFSNIVQQRTSYTVEELVFGAKFQPMFRRADDGSATILELDKINEYQVMPLPEPETSTVNV